MAQRNDSLSECLRHKGEETSTENTLLKNNRLVYIDYLETIAIFCVVCCHYNAVMGTGLASNMFMLFAKCFGVPIFFLVNGALVFQRNFSLKKHLKKTGMLILTTASWKGAYLFVQCMKLRGGIAVCRKSDLWNYFCGTNLSEPYVPAEHFWYMYALIGVYFVVPLFMAIYNEKKTYYFYLILLLLAIQVFTELDALITNLTTMNIAFSTIRSSYFPFAQGGYYLLFFLIGPLVHNYFYKTKRKKKRRLAAGILAVSGMIWLILEYYMQNRTLVGAHQPLQGDYQRLSTLVMAVGMFGLFATIDWNRKKCNAIMQFVSARTIGIYAAHMYIAYRVSPWIVSKTARTGIGMLVLQAIGVMICSLLITEGLSLIPGVRDVLGLSYYKIRKKYWMQLKAKNKE